MNPAQQRSSFPPSQFQQSQSSSQFQFQSHSHPQSFAGANLPQPQQHAPTPVDLGTAFFSAIPTSSAYHHQQQLGHEFSTTIMPHQRQYSQQQDGMAIGHPTIYAPTSSASHPFAPSSTMMSADASIAAQRTSSLAISSPRHSAMSLAPHDQDRERTERQSYHLMHTSPLPGRKSYKTIRGVAELVWPPYLEGILLEALYAYKPSPSISSLSSVRHPFRNKFISKYIESKVGVKRTPRQVGSRLQQLRDTVKGKELLDALETRGLALLRQEQHQQYVDHKSNASSPTLSPSCSPSSVKSLSPPLSSFHPAYTVQKIPSNALSYQFVPTSPHGNGTISSTALALGSSDSASGSGLASESASVSIGSMSPEPGSSAYGSAIDLELQPPLQLEDFSFLAPSSTASGTRKAKSKERGGFGDERKRRQRRVLSASRSISPPSAPNVNYAMRPAGQTSPTFATFSIPPLSPTMSDSDGSSNRMSPVGFGHYGLHSVDGGSDGYYGSPMSGAFDIPSAMGTELANANDADWTHYAMGGSSMDSGNGASLFAGSPFLPFTSSPRLGSGSGAGSGHLPLDVLSQFHPHAQSWSPSSPSLIDFDSDDGSSSSLSVLGGMMMSQAHKQAMALRSYQPGPVVGPGLPPLAMMVDVEGGGQTGFEQGGHPYYG